MAKPLQQDEEGKIVNDKETAKAQKGYDSHEADNARKQREMEARDEKLKQKVKSGVEKVRGVMGFSKGGSASSRADGCAIKGKTRGRMV